MFEALSKLLPPFVYPLGLTALLLVGALVWARRRPTWTRTLVALALSVLLIGGNRVVAVTLCRSLEWRYTPPSPMPRTDVVVVLGGATRPHDWPRPMAEINEAGDRLFYAAYLFHQGVAPKVLLAGGGAFLEEPGFGSEADMMADVMALLNVPPEVLVKEGLSRNTRQNAVYSQPLLDSLGVRTLTLVTSATHMPRAVGVFRKLGYDVVPAPTDYYVSKGRWAVTMQPSVAVQLANLIPTAESLFEVTKALKEYIGYTVYGWRGWL